MWHTCTQLDSFTCRLAALCTRQMVVHWETVTDPLHKFHLEGLSKNTIIIQYPERPKAVCHFLIMHIVCCVFHLIVNVLHYFEETAIAYKVGTRILILAHYWMAYVLPQLVPQAHHTATVHACTTATGAWQVAKARTGCTTVWHAIPYMHHRWNCTCGARCNFRLPLLALAPWNC